MGGGYGALLEVRGPEGEERLQPAWGPHSPLRMNSTITDASLCLLERHTWTVGGPSLGRRGRRRGAPGARGPGPRSGSVSARRSSVSATAAICDSTPRPRRSSQTSCSSCCCASPKTWSPSPRSTSAPSRSATPRPRPCARPTGPAPSARWTPGTSSTRRGAAVGDLQEVGRSPGTQRGTGGTHPRGAPCKLRGFFFFF